jgi:hypothetical protein
MRSRALLGWIGMMAAVVACGLGGSSTHPPPIDPTRYDQSCQSAADCIVVSGGDVCAPCVGGPFDSCDGTAAINKTDQARFQTDYANLKAQCPSMPPQNCPAICEVTNAACTAGTCTVCHSQHCGDAGAPDAGGADAGGDAAQD